ncbi:glycosyltransferase family 2 protein [Flavobacterium sp.]|uniref:glycosyltransferase family 2 protein n=1 Tax=Flavobacterium sp. TaxID=239 RepID=UPI00374DD28C
MDYKIYVVVITYNPKKWIDVCFKSLQKSSIPVKTIVIDNCSTDGSVDIIKNEFPEVDFIQCEKNLGFGKANNIGIKKAYDSGADYVFLLNQDAWVQEDTIQKLVQVAKLNPQYGIVSPMHLNGDGNAFDYGFSNYIIPSKCKNLLSDIYLNKTEDKLYNTNFINAAAWLLSRRTIEEIGGFSPSFFHYGEDDNYCQRVLYHDLQIGVYPDTQIYHDREQRAKSDYFTDEKLFYKRKIIFEFSNPSSKRIKQSFYKFEIKNLYLSLLSLDFKLCKRIVRNITVLNTINFSEINKNKELSKKKGIHFL